MLDQIKIASPCAADWDRMEGNDRVRFCAECKKNVFNLSAMTRRDAEALLKETNGNLCTRLYRRADGTVLTQDCPVGLRVKIARVRRRVGWAIAGALGFATAWGQEKPPALSGVVEGIVPDLKGVTLRGIGNAYVIAAREKSTEWVRAEVNQKGEFQFRDLEPGSYTVIALGFGFAESVANNVPVGGAEKKLQFLLQVGRVDQGSVGQE
jgi:hypothetical protein